MAEIMFNYHSKIYVIGANAASIAASMLCKMGAKIVAEGGFVKSTGVDREYAEKKDVVFINFAIGSGKIKLIDEEKIEGWSDNAFIEHRMTKEDVLNTALAAFDATRTRLRGLFGAKHRPAMQ